MKLLPCAPLLLAAALTLMPGCGKKDNAPTVESIIANTNLVADQAPPAEEPATNVVIDLAEVEAENRAKVEQAIATAKTLLQEDKLAQATRALQEVAQLRLTPEEKEQIKSLQEEIQKAMLAKVTVSGPMSEEVSNLLQKAARGEQ